jgi:hypothetical protein
MIFVQSLLNTIIHMSNIVKMNCLIGFLIQSTCAEFSYLLHPFLIQISKSVGSFLYQKWPNQLSSDSLDYSWKHIKFVLTFSETLLTVSLFRYIAEIEGSFQV